jgi:hypothetical protein
MEAMLAARLSRAEGIAFLTSEAAAAEDNVLGLRGKEGGREGAVAEASQRRRWLLGVRILL